MPTLSNSTFSVVLDDSGNRAVYSVQPRFYGEQLAVKIGGQWYKTGAKELITDLRTIALLERVPSAHY
jgi:hypothetical protein